MFSVAVAITVVNSYAYKFPVVSDVAHKLLAAPLGMLLVFRTNLACTSKTPTMTNTLAQVDGHFDPTHCHPFPGALILCQIVFIFEACVYACVLREETHGI